ncbi:hypothetical protein M5K25_025302 [Dendrobium thyrsiflorum]|uniref:Uncharacterized protein n=1 Tax=Dendrobium thyrsiflorum TaxID=117978 RepID=A0ABD0U3Z7_DENTH
MFAGEQEGNGVPAVGDLTRRVLTGESSSIRGCGGSGEDEEGRCLDSEGFPDGFGRAEKNALVARIEELEKELYDYQYHMGLLLIEKKKRTSEFEGLREELSEARENLKLERAAFSSTLSEKKKQELSVQIALETERQHVADLERTIYKMLAVEKYLTEQRETLQSWEPSLQEHELELKGSQNFLDERMMNVTYEKEEFSEIQEEVEENPNSFVIKNNASNYGEAFISERHQNLASKKKDAASKQENLEKKERDLLTTQVKLPTRDSALQSEKLVFDHELEGGRKSLDCELQDKLNKLGMQNAVKGKDESQTIDDHLAHKMEVETDEVKVQKDKETLNTFYNRLQKFKQELMKKRDLLLSLSEHCKACMNCSIIFSEIDLVSLETFEGAELADDILLLSIPSEHLEKKRIKGQNDDSSPQTKGYESVKIGGCMPFLQQCSELCNFNSGGSGPYLAADGNERKATDVEIRSQPMPVISYDNLDNVRVEPGNGARKIERCIKVVHSSKRYSEIANDGLDVECQLNSSSIYEQNESHAFSSKAKSISPTPIKRIGSMKAVVKNSEETLEDIPKEIKQLQNCGSENLKDANEKSKLNLLNADKLGGSAEQQEFLCDATSTFEIDSYDRKMKTINEGHRKRKRTFDIEFNFPGQKRYNFRPSTILKVLVSKMQSEHVFGTASDEEDIYYEPSSSD